MRPTAYKTIRMSNLDAFSHPVDIRTAGSLNNRSLANLPFTSVARWYYTCAHLTTHARTCTLSGMPMTDNYSRRDFLAQTAAAVAFTAASSTLACAPSRNTPPADLNELSATAAIAAMQRGDITAENYARALLDRAAVLGSLNAFRVLTPDTVLEAARAADKARAAGGKLGLDSSKPGERHDETP